MDQLAVAPTRVLFRAESHLRNQMMLLASTAHDYTLHMRTQSLHDAIRILFEAGWRTQRMQ
jgi:hypothetical protein